MSGDGPPSIASLFPSQEKLNEDGSLHHYGINVDPNMTLTDARISLCALQTRSQLGNTKINPGVMAARHGISNSNMLDLTMKSKYALQAMIYQHCYQLWYQDTSDRV